MKNFRTDPFTFNQLGAQRVGYSAQVQIWEDYLNNITTAYQSSSCFKSAQQSQPVSIDTHSKINPWLQ